MWGSVFDWGTHNQWWENIHSGLKEFFLQEAVSQVDRANGCGESICFIYLEVYVNFPGILLKSMY